MQENKKNKVEEIPIEEFDNDNQDFHKEFLDKFSKEYDSKEENDITKSFENE